MIIVLDTNVIISALLSPQGPPAEIVRRWEAEEIEVVTSPPLIGELERVLTYPRVRGHLRFSDEDIDALLERLMAITPIVDPQSTLEMVTTDPTDKRVLECAIAGGASYIVTGDTHLLELKEYRQIMIVAPAAFLAVLGPEG